MLGQVARETDNLADQLDGLCKAAILWVKAQFTDPLGVDPAFGHTPYLTRQACSHILTKAHHLAHLADSGTRPKVDHSCAKPRAVPTIFFINVLDDLFTAFMFEIYVDIRRLASEFRHKPFHHHGDGFGADIRDAQQIAKD